MKEKLFPYIIFMLLLWALVSLVIVGTKVMWDDKGRVIVPGSEDMSTTDLAYYIHSSILSLLSFFFGAVWMAGRKSFDLDNFCRRFKSVDICDHVIDRTKRQRKFLEKQEELQLRREEAKVIKEEEKK